MSRRLQVRHSMVAGLRGLGKRQLVDAPLRDRQDAERLAREVVDHLSRTPRFAIAAVQPVFARHKRVFDTPYIIVEGCLALYKAALVTVLTLGGVVVMFCMYTVRSRGGELRGPAGNPQKWESSQKKTLRRF